jgi:hypothetical protein
MSKLPRFVAVLCVVLSVAGAAFADELMPTEQKGRWQPARQDAPLLYLLPSLGTQDPVTMEIRVFDGKRQFITEVVKLPGLLPAGATIDVLVTHEKELAQLRAIEAERPGSLRFIALVEGRVVTDEPFAAIEKRAKDLSPRSAVGEVFEVKVRPEPELSLRTLDACTENCDYQYQECYARCDERGDSCARCSDDYNNCLRYCPQPCTEPKSVSSYTIWVPTNYAYFGQKGCFSAFHPTTWGREYEYRYVYYSVRTYQRTTHCNGSYTDTLTGQYTTAGWCWWETFWSCSPTTGRIPYGQICRR